MSYERVLKAIEPIFIRDSDDKKTRKITEFLDDDYDIINNTGTRLVKEYDFHWNTVNAEYPSHFFCLKYNIRNGENSKTPGLRESKWDKEKVISKYNSLLKELESKPGRLKLIQRWDRNMLCIANKGDFQPGGTEINSYYFWIHYTGMDRKWTE